MAMTALGNGLSAVNKHEDALVVKEAELAMLRRIGAKEESVLVTQSNIANTYAILGQLDRALSMQRDVYFGTLRVHGEEYGGTMLETNNYAGILGGLGRFEETKSLTRKAIPISRRVLGEGHHLTLKMRSIYAVALWRDDGATLDDLREAVSTLEDAGRIAQRVFGGAHPLTLRAESNLRNARAALAAREGDLCEALRKAEV